LQFWQKANTGREKAWQDYLRLCRAGGSKPFLELVALANLNNPFTGGTLEAIVPPVREWLHAHAGEFQ